MARWFSNLAVVKWYQGLSNGGKAAVGCVLFALSLVLAFVTGGMSAAIQVTVEVAIGVGVGIGVWALSALATGQQLTRDGLATAALDSFVVSSLFAFVQQSVNAIKYVARSKPHPEADLAVECAGYCFIAGTLVHCEDGLKKIEDVKVGDKVLAYNEETGEQAYKTVLRLFRNESKDWTGITVNDKEIVSTPGHKYYLPITKQWVSAKDLKVGDTVLLSNGQRSKVQETRSIYYETPQTTYNFEVEDFHTYYVATGVLVHNKECKSTIYVDTVDDALDMAEKHLGPSQHYYKGDKNILVSDIDPRKIVRFDIDLTSNHVKKFGQHLNIETYYFPFGMKGKKLINIHVYWRN